MKMHSVIELQFNDSHLVCSDCTMVSAYSQETKKRELHLLITLQENHQRPSLMIGSYY